jgi:predicted unusual protein kinase regulating ubiquinone biosynthesis (AarF/ABC1/UbiB family)
MLFLKIIFLFFKYIFIYLFFYDINFYENLLFELSNINIIFIKIFQWLSSEKNISKKYLTLLNKYLDNSPYDDNSIDKETLLSLLEYSKNNNYNLEICSFIPYKSGSINLIFTGYLDNKKIIIKMLRKNIKQKVEESIIFFYYISNIFYFIFYIYNLHDIIYDVINKNKKILLDQTNLKKELENIKLFKNKYKKTDYIIIPNVYEDFTNKFNNLIIMDYIDGDIIYNIKKEDKEEFKKIYIKYSYSYLEKEIIHGDLHIGNILFCKINNKHKLGLIDFGIINILGKSELDLSYKLLKTNNIEDFLKTLIYLLKNFINIKNNKNNKNINIDTVIDELYKDVHNYCIKNIEAINNNLFDLSAVKYMLYRINYYDMEINERIAQFITSLAIINSLTLYFTDKDSFINNKEVINVLKKLEL